MSFPTELATYLQTNSIGTIGTSLFDAKVPDGKDVAKNRVIFLEDETGTSPGDLEYVPEFQEQIFEFVIYNTDKDAGADKRLEIRTLLHGKNNVDLSNWRILHSVVYQEGGCIGENKGVYEFIIRFRIKYLAI